MKKILNMINLREEKEDNDSYFSFFNVLIRFDIFLIITELQSKW